MLNSKPKIREYVDVIFQRKWLFTISFASAVTLSLVLCFAIPPVYRAQVKIEIITNPLVGDYDVSTSVKKQLITLKERLLSQSSLEQLIKKIGPAKSRDRLPDRKIIHRLGKETKIHMKNNQLVIISYDDSDRERTAKITKLMANAFIKESFKKREEETNSAVDFIKNEVDFYRDKLRGEEEAFHSPDPLAKQLKGKLMKLENELSGLLIDRTEDHPAVINIRNAIAETKEELKKTNDGKDVEDQMLEDVRMEREMRLNEGLYAQLLSKLEVARISQRLKAEEEMTKFRIIDLDRIPVWRIVPDRRKVIFSGLMIGIMLGVTFIAIAEFGDHSFKVVTDAKAYLPLPILGAIPRVMSYGQRRVRGRPPGILIKKALEHKTKEIKKRIEGKHFKAKKLREMIEKDKEETDRRDRKRKDLFSKET